MPNRILSELIGSAVLAAVADPTDDKIAAALEAITVSQLNLDLAQEALYQAFTNQQQGVEPLLNLAVAVGLSLEALTRRH